MCCSIKICFFMSLSYVCSLPNRMWQLCMNNIQLPGYAVGLLLMKKREKEKGRKEGREGGRGGREGGREEGKEGGRERH